MPIDTDKYLLGAIHEGDYHAFEVLYNIYYSDLCKFANSFVHSPETAKDIVSDLFFKLWEQQLIPTVNISLKGYLFRSIYNSCINYLLRRQPKFRALNSETIDKLYELLPAIQDENASAGLLAAELNDEIEKAIDQLPPECGKIFKLSRKEELSHKEIAQKLNISENTVKVQIYRALSKLRESLKEYLIDNF